MKPYITAEMIAKALPKGKQVGPGKFTACCRAHDDHNPSLNITQGEDKILVHCFAGCAQEAVLSALIDLDLWTKGAPVQAAQAIYRSEYEEAKYKINLAEADQENGKIDEEWEIKNRESIEAAQRVLSKKKTIFEPETTLSSVELVRGDTLTPSAISWIWPGWIAEGKFHILAGSPGTGKTTLALLFAKTITIGGPWPDGSAASPGSVLIWSGEDNPSDTLLPRLIAHGANINHIYFVENVNDAKKGKRPFDPALDMVELQRAAEQIGDVGLIIVDPVVNVVTGDSHRNIEVRRALQPLVDLAQNLRAAIVGITHLSKGSGNQQPLEQVTGSLAFGALARIVLLVQKRDDKDSHILVRVKSNIGKDGGGFEYKILQKELPNYPGLIASYAELGEFVDQPANELLSNDVSEQSALEEAKEFLLSELTAGPIGAKVILERAEKAGLSAAVITP